MKSVHNPQKDEIQKAANRRKILEAGYRLFTERTIDGVSLEEVAKASGIGVSTLYRYFGTKADLAIAVSVWKWEDYLQQIRQRPAEKRRKMNGAENFAYYLDSFLELYRDHRDLLRYNQFFNVYLQSASVDKARMIPYEQVIAGFEELFHAVWEKGAKDGTLRTDLPWQQVFSATMHMMLAVTTRYAVGLAYQPEESATPEEELRMLRNMMLKQFCRSE